MREKIVGIIMYFLLLNLMNLFLLHHIIYSILIGNMKKSKHRYKKGTIIAHQYSLFERLKQDYIKKYITIFRKEYKFYMVLKKFCIIWTLLFPCVLVLLELFTPYSSLAADIGMCTSIILGIFSALHFNLDRKTKYELNGF